MHVGTCACAILQDVWVSECYRKAHISAVLPVRQEIQHFVSLPPNSLHWKHPRYLDYHSDYYDFDGCNVPYYRFHLFVSLEMARISPSPSIASLLCMVCMPRWSQTPCHQGQMPLVGYPKVNKSWWMGQTKISSVRFVWKWGAQSSVKSGRRTNLWVWPGTLSVNGICIVSLFLRPLTVAVAVRLLVLTMEAILKPGGGHPKWERPSSYRRRPIKFG